MMTEETTGGFLGRGWSFPPVFVKGVGAALMTAGEANVNESLRTLLNTRLGERPFRPLYGTRLRDMMFQPLSSIQQGDLITFLKANISEYEPRIDLEEITISLQNQPDSSLIISISYRIIAVNSRHNFVYPYYLNEGSHLSNQ